MPPRQPTVPELSSAAEKPPRPELPWTPRCPRGGWVRARGGWQGVVERYLYACTSQSTLSVCLVVADGGRSGRMCACQGPGAPRAPPHVTVETLDSETGYSHVRRAMGPGAAFPAMSWPGPQCTAIRGHSAGKKAPRASLLGRLGLITQAGS